MEKLWPPYINYTYYSELNRVFLLIPRSVFINPPLQARKVWKVQTKINPWSQFPKKLYIFSCRKHLHRKYAREKLHEIEPHFTSFFSETGLFKFSGPLWIRGVHYCNFHLFLTLFRTTADPVVSPKLAYQHQQVCCQFLQKNKFLKYLASIFRKCDISNGYVEVYRFDLFFFLKKRLYIFFF